MLLEAVRRVASWDEGAPPPGEPVVVTGVALQQVWPWAVQWTPAGLAREMGAAQGMARFYRIGAARHVREGECMRVRTTVAGFVAWMRGEVDGEESKALLSLLPRSEYWGYLDYCDFTSLLQGDDGTAHKIVDCMPWSSMPTMHAEHQKQQQGEGQTMTGDDDHDIGDEHHQYAACNPMDASLWVGTAGAHTALHYDTHGRNLVVQLHGRKRWTLFPPHATSKLHPTRVPYEHSSVYSRVDIRSPDFTSFPSLRGLHGLAVTLHPGEVLLVPPRWWHAVDCLEDSVSVNKWVPVPDDRAMRMHEQEALTMLLANAIFPPLHVHSAAHGCDADAHVDDDCFHRDAWLNPTDSHTSVAESIRILHRWLRKSQPQPQTGSDKEQQGKGNAGHDDGTEAYMEGGPIAMAMDADTATSDTAMQQLAGRVFDAFAQPAVLQTVLNTLQAEDK